MATIQDIIGHIRTAMPATVRIHKKSEGTLIGLPFPYTIPCIRDAFQELYYWDTYFACRGLAILGDNEQIFNNCENFMYELEQFGFIPNGSRTFYLDRSQPPFFGKLAELACDLQPHRPDFTRRMTASLVKELDFWNKKRKDESSGLYHYGSDASEKELLAFYECCTRRLGYPDKADDTLRKAASSEAMAEAESGWDFNPRFERRCRNYAAVDLNALLLADLRILAKLYTRCGDFANAAAAEETFQREQERFNKIFFDSQRNCYADYDFVNQKFSPVLSAAGFFPIWCGVASADKAITALSVLKQKLEYPHGIAACEPSTAGKIYQWDFPTLWPPLQLIAMESFLKTGLFDDARRIAQKYIDTVRNNFDTTGDLWEKYNAVTGKIDVAEEYQMPRMMGWTAGTFLVATQILDA